MTLRPPTGSRTPPLVSQRVHRAALVLFLAAAAAVAGPPMEERLATAQDLLDAGDAEAALDLLDRLVKTKPPDARAFLLRSTALFMMGEVARGRRDLERSLEIDPSLRQAWLNLAALDLSEKRYPQALEALEKAKEIDPSAPDNDLNIGAVLLLQGRLQDATDHFSAYLQRSSPSAQALYLVATNYAMAGYADPAIEHLQRAIELDEKTRLTARTDPNFRDLESNARYQSVLNTDTYRPPPGAHERVLEVEIPYEGSDSVLLRAVLDALQFSGQPFDRRVEATPDWALIWGEMRIKLTRTADNRGTIHCSAPAERFTSSQWRQKTEALMREITIRLQTRRQ